MQGKGKFNFTSKYMKSKAVYSAMKDVDRVQNVEIKKLKKQVKTLKDDTEVKQRNTGGIGAGTEIGSAAIVSSDLFAGLAQGDAEGNRDGTKVSPKYLQLQVSIRGPNDAGATSDLDFRIRLFVVRMKSSTSSIGTGDFPAVGGYWTDTQKNSFSRILFDKEYRLAPITSSATVNDSYLPYRRIITIKKKLSGQTNFLTGDTTTENGGVMICAISNVALATYATGITIEACTVNLLFVG